MKKKQVYETPEMELIEVSLEVSILEASVTGADVVGWDDEEEDY